MVAPVFASLVEIESGILVGVEVACGRRNCTYFSRVHLLHLRLFSAVACERTWMLSDSSRNYGWPI